jgi:hypothetical protein
MTVELGVKFRPRCASFEYWDKLCRNPVCERRYETRAKAYYSPRVNIQ